MTTIQQRFGLNDALSQKDTPLMFGTECEIESVYDFSRGEWWNIEADGSLRNNGQEFISIPLDKERSIKAFEYLHKHLSYRNKDEAFSPRTSIHVHVNCKNLEEDVVKNVLLLYALYEEVFFMQVDPSRKDNIHCVALSDTHLPHRYNFRVVDLQAAWSKYTAFNLKPLASYGTIEFRHSEGHADVKRYTEWLTVLENLFNLAKSVKVEPVTLTQENVTLWFDQIFGHVQDYPSIRLRLSHYVENSLIDVKLAFQ